NKDIAPIIFRHCAACHRPGEVAPFPLLTYQDVKQRATLIATVVEKRVMPPWKPEPGYGNFRDARRLSDNQIALFQSWINQGMVEGGSEDLPPSPRFPAGWSLGTPDLVVTMPQPFQVPADGPDIYRCFLLSTGVVEDRYLAAFDLRPSNRK